MAGKGSAAHRRDRRGRRGREGAQLLKVGKDAWIAHQGARGQGTGGIKETLELKDHGHLARGQGAGVAQAASGTVEDLGEVLEEEQSRQELGCRAGPEEIVDGIRRQRADPGVGARNGLGRR